ncbi:MAG: rRNA pseudouridine synthase [Clostridia bacterium]|nr:rRNA pseudouridine synthase [Clostridia bacterium]
MRINKFLAECGVASRRQCDKLIEEGAVKVNGKPCALGAEVDDGDTVTVNGKRVTYGNKREYYIMNKPKGYVCTVSDDKGRKTVMELLPKHAGRVFPVGRLDYATEGLLLFTNDGDLAFRLTHPKNEIPKTYTAKIEGTVTDKELDKLRFGVEIDGRMTHKCNARITESDKDHTKVTVTITEGRNRQVRKMFEAIGKEVAFLKRIKIGDLTLRGLDRGECRPLTPSEVEYLKLL